MPFPQTPSPLNMILAAKTYNAAWFSGSTNELKITNAIAQAAADGASFVFITKDMLPYIAANVTFNSAVRLLRENGNWDVIEVQAYGADPSVSDNSAALSAAFTAAEAFKLPLHFGTGTYTTTTGISGGTTGVVIRGEGRERTVLNYTGSTNGAILTPAGIRGYTIQDMTIKTTNAGAACVKLTADFGHVRLINLKLDSTGKGVDASAGNGIDIYAESVRVSGGTVGFELASGGIAINTVTLVNCYAVSCAQQGFNFGNCSGICIGCSADGNNQGYQCGGNLVFLGCTAENNTVEGWALVGNQTYTLIDCVTTAQLLPFRVAAANCNARFLSCRTTSTPSGASLDITSAANVYVDNVGFLDAGLTSAANTFLNTTLGSIRTNGQVLTKASSTTEAGIRLPHGSAPTSPVNGDMWTTTAGLFVRINGATVGPLT